MATKLGSRRRGGPSTAPWRFLAPALAFFVFVVVVPSVQGAGYAFTDWDGITPAPGFAGLDNFRTLLDDETARLALVNTLLAAVGITVVQNVIGLLLALGVHARIRSRTVLRVFFFAPAVITPVVTAYCGSTSTPRKARLTPCSPRWASGTGSRTGSVTRTWRCGRWSRWSSGSSPATRW
ncbi:carbohydrate ABC transporter permease [Amycolatopsis magusensis]|uniref:carbohydrate ABC transporter permease n=1 Tax=Amycolatopsis magusensis TaxID=882444 RepID=UPI0037BBEB48